MPRYFLFSRPHFATPICNPHSRPTFCDSHSRPTFATHIRDSHSRPTFATPFRDSHSRPTFATHIRDSFFATRIHDYTRDSTSRLAFATTLATLVRDSRLRSQPRLTIFCRDFRSATPPLTDGLC